MRAAGATLAIAMAGAAWLAPPVAAQELEEAERLDQPPVGYELTPSDAVKIARSTPEARGERREHPDLEPAAYTDGPGRWQVSFTADGDELAQVQIDDRSGLVLEAWTGAQVAWRMARGYEGAFGGKLHAPYVWLPLCSLFLLPFVDPRRPFRVLHLDLLVLLAFGVSHLFFNRGEIFWSVPLVYPVLLYLLARMLWVGFRPRERRERLVPFVPAIALALGLLFLVGFRVALNVADTNVIDVGYAGVIGADRVADGEGLYDGDFHGENEHGDTYGPVNYLAYLPFEQLLPWSGDWDDLPAAHGAAIAFDLLTIVGLFLLGRRLRAGPEGRLLGLSLAFAWASYPYTLFVLASNANDSLVAMLVVYALLAVTSAPGRGALLGLAAAAKFAPLALAPLFARGADGASADGRRGWGARVRGAVLFTVAFGAVVAASVALFVPDDGLRELYDRTVGYQVGRDSPFSVWGQVGSLDWLHTAVKVGVVALALAVAVVPRRRGPVQVAALAAAVVIALQLAATHWFYLYVVWFAPLALVAMFASYRGDAGGATPVGGAPLARAGEEPTEARVAVPA
ncbi:MAG: glycosyltransferase 87 family protein [Thermoleophilaceae bacterium]